MTFETNVFINCPFDAEFKPILHAMLFTIIYHGLTPRIATERIDSGEQRISKIIDLIKESKYSVHDLSRVKATSAGEMFRLNMPYELGIDVGCRRFGAGKLKTKQYLVTASEHYEYQKALSDIAGTDIAVHKNDPLDAVRAVRQWIDNVYVGDEGSQAIWAAYEDFNAQIYDEMEAKGFDAQERENVQTAKLIKSMEKFVKDRKHRKSINGSLNKAHSERFAGIRTDSIEFTLPDRKKINPSNVNRKIKVLKKRTDEIRKDGRTLIIKRVVPG